MRTANGLRRALEAGETVLGASAETYHPTVVEVFGDIGLDFVWVDLEHGGPSPWDSTALEDLTRAAEAGDVELLVRIPSPDPPMVRKVLDAGVRTILLPRIESAEQLRRGVEAAHFAYDGEAGDRGVGVGRSATWRGYDEAFVAREDSEVMVGTMIENVEAVQAIDDILGVPDLGFAFVGPADLSVSMARGDLDGDHGEAVDAAVERTREACHDHGIPVGRIRNDVDTAQEAIDEGYQLVRVGGDTLSIRESLGRKLDALE